MLLILLLFGKKNTTDTNYWFISHNIGIPKKTKIKRQFFINEEI